jgi:hypothetical protein
VGIDKVFALGISQAGRYLQEHLVSGFNQDEQKRIVFDGLLIDIAGAGKTFTNFALANLVVPEALIRTTISPRIGSRLRMDRN